MGAALVGMTRRGAAPSPVDQAGWGETRPQPTAPDRQSCVEPAGVVVGDAGGEEGALPLDGGGFEAFELGEGFEEAFFAGELGLRERGAASRGASA